MLSVLIPVYNFDIRPFVAELDGQCAAAGVPYEILVFDDGSAAAYQQLNQAVGARKNVLYRARDRNVGRSAIRNALVAESRFDLLLILDCDGWCPDDRFIQRYLDVHDAAPVVYGGRTYPPRGEIEPGEMLHWKYGRQREAVPVDKRNEMPYKAFMTNNFLIHRSVYEQVKMDETLVGYGHEDTLYALELKACGIRILHIDNPLIHIGLEPGAVFLEKTRQGTANLAMLLRRGVMDKSITLVRYYLLAKRLGCTPLLRGLGHWLEPLMERHLTGPRPRLRVFDLYKLCLLSGDMGKG